MNRVFQPGIDKPTQELTDQILKDITQKPENNTLIDNYRQMKQESVCRLHTRLHRAPLRV